METGRRQQQSTAGDGPGLLLARPALARHRDARRVGVQSFLPGRNGGRGRYVGRPPRQRPGAGRVPRKDGRCLGDHQPGRPSEARTPQPGDRLRPDRDRDREETAGPLRPVLAKKDKTKDPAKEKEKEKGKEKGKAAGKETGPESPTEPEYPGWLAEGWNERERWSRSDDFLAAPRAFRMLQVALLCAEQDWRGGGDPAEVRTRFEGQLAAVRAERKKRGPTLRNPSARSDRPSSSAAGAPTRPSTTS